MRISTNTMFDQGLALMLDQQSALARLQRQLSSGDRLSSAADDPAAFAQSQSLDDRLAELERHAQTTQLVRHRLSSEEAALADTTRLLQRVRELTVQANNATLGATERAALATEIDQRMDELLAIANRDDGAGHYLFAGAASGAAPFALDASGAVYAGDEQTRRQTIAPGQSLAEGDSGAEVFLRLRDGTGVIRIEAAAGNTGSGRVSALTLADASAWTGDRYQVSFSGGNYEVRDSSNALVASGAYQPGRAITFAGVSLGVDGSPADGDALSVGPSRSQDVFRTLGDLRDALRASPTAAARHNALFSGLQNLDGALDHLSQVRASVGARLQSLDAADAARDALSEQMQSVRSSLRDVDYASAVSAMQLKLTALQAAQQAFLRVQGLSLFDRL